MNHDEEHGCSCLISICSRSGWATLRGELATPLPASHAGRLRVVTANYRQEGNRKAAKSGTRVDNHAT